MLLPPGLESESSLKTRCPNKRLDGSSCNPSFFVLMLNYLFFVDGHLEISPSLDGHVEKPNLLIDSAGLQEEAPGFEPSNPGTSGQRGPTQIN